MKLSVSLFFLISWLSLQTAHAQVPLFDEAGRTFRPSVWDLKFQSSYFEAAGNYDKGGGEASLPQNSSYKLMLFDFGTRWVPKRNWGLYVSGQIANAESKDRVDTRTNSSYTQTLVGTDLVLYSQRNFTLIPDFYTILPFTRVNTGEDLALNAEGAFEVTSRLIGRGQFGMFRPFGFVGFTYRDEDRSSLLPYGIGSELQFTKWILGAELRGYQTVVNDKYSDTPQSRHVVARYNGGALRFFSVDPALLETNLWLKRDFGQAWTLKGGGGTTLTGANMTRGWNIFAGISYAFQPSSKPAPQPYQSISPSQPAPESDDSSRFQETTEDGVNQEYFYQHTPPQPAPKPAQPSAEQQKKQMQKELDQTQFQIELKTSKPAKKKKP